MSRNKDNNDIAENKFVVSQLLKSKRYSDVEKDIIKAKCTKEEYSFDEIDKIINDFKKGTVK